MFDTLKFYKTLVAGGYTEEQAEAVTEATLVAMREHSAYLDAHSKRAAFYRALKAAVSEPAWWWMTVGFAIWVVALALP